MKHATELRNQLDTVMNEFNALIDATPAIKLLALQASETDTPEGWLPYVEAIRADSGLRALMNQAKELANEIAIEEGR